MGSNLPHVVYADTQHRYKAALAKLIEDLGHSFAITLSWNDMNVSLEQARDDVKRLLWAIDKRLLGSRAHLYPAEKRTSAVFCFEGLGRYEEIHAHSTWRAPPGQWLPFCKLFPRDRSGLWDTIVRKGSHRLDFASPIASNPEITGYILKQQHRNSDSFEIVFSSEFHPAR